ncbi:MAG: translation initiation factor IF-2 [Anaerobutyricum sp.]|nr:translation initiation factor IF-2 [Anaerobutyricum sp.]
MPKMRVHEVAKLLGKSSKEVIAALKQQGIDVQSHMSTVTDEQVDQLKNSYNKKEEKKETRPVNTPKKETKEMKAKESNRENNSRPAARTVRDNRTDNRNNNRGENRNNNRPDNRSGRDSRTDSRNNNRGENRNNNRGGNDNRRNKSSLGDTPINAKETRNGRENRHDINREHSRDNKENSRNENRGGKNNRRGNNRNNDFNNQKKQKNKNKQQAPVQPPKKEEPKEEVIRNITLPDPVSLKDLADACKVQPSVIIKKLFLAGQMVTINTEFSFDDAAEIALEYNCIAEEEVKVDVIEELLKEEEEDEKDMTPRPPVVCVMGHVDHGKTSLLDAIRSTHVTAGEAGGITQHIGAYVVEINGEKITFLDTPGHEAFTSMRLRGAQATDIAVLVVAADDGVMPQTIEAINHAKAAEVEVIVAVNKIDKEGANVDRVKQELTEYGLIAEDWGGSTVFVPVSAKTGEGISDLLEMISLTAEVLELKANAKRKARGLVIEAKLDKGRGPVATILIQKGTLHVGDSINVGHAFGRVRAMIDDKGNRVKAAGPSTPVEILGLNDVPFSGEVLMAHDNEKEARATADAFIAYGREKMLEDTKNKLSLDDLFDQIQAGNVKELNLVVKADVQGSVEAVKQSLTKLSNDEVMIKVVHGGVGAINESDVILASASNAIIIGFNVRPDAMAKSVAEREKVDMRLYRVIYNAIEDIEAAIKGMLDPVYREKVIGHVEVRQIYKASGVGTIAGCYVADGMITKTSQARIVRDGIVIYEGLLASLKRFKDDVKEVKAGFECGIVFEKYNDIKEGDQIEAFVMEEIPR